MKNKTKFHISCDAPETLTPEDFEKLKFIPVDVVTNLPNWKYRLDKHNKPISASIRVGRFRIYIHRHKKYKDKWLATYYPWVLERVELEAVELNKCKVEAMVCLMKILQETLDELQLF